MITNLSLVKLSSNQYKFYGRCYVIADGSLYLIDADRKVREESPLDIDVNDTDFTALATYINSVTNIPNEEFVYIDDKNLLREYDNHLLTDEEIATSMISIVL